MLYSRYSPVKQCEQRDVTHLKNDIEIDAIITPDLRVQPFLVPVAVLVARIAVFRGRLITNSSRERIDHVPASRSGLPLKKK